MSGIASEFRVRALAGIPEVVPGDDLAELVLEAAAGTLEEGDIVVITSKVLSKAEGRTRPAAEREQAIAEETVRVVASRERNGHTLRIVENRLGVVAAAAGVDASNTAHGTILLLPEDPDASARTIARDLRARTGLRIGVVITDTLGRPWRAGQTDVAIGAAGVHVIEDLRGVADAAGQTMAVTMPCVADELAAAAELVKHKTQQRPVAVVSGLGRLVGGLDLPGAAAIVRLGADDMFRLGTEEAIEQGRREGYAAGLAAAEQQSTDDVRKGQA